MVKKRFYLKNFWIYTILILYLIYTLYPLYLMVVTSLKGNREIMSNPIGIPANPTLEGFIKLFQKESFGIYFLNTVFVTVVSVLLLLIVTIPMSYALSRYINKLSRCLYFIFLAGMMIPLRLGLLSLNELLYNIKLIDNHWGLIFIFVAMNIPTTMLIITGFIKIIPVALEESAFIDGASTWLILWRIVCPMIKPAVATSLAYSFVPIWNDVFFPLIFIKSKGKMVLMQAVTMFFGQYSTNWNMVFSALTVACIPVVLIYLLCSKYLIKGLMAGSLKG